MPRNLLAIENTGDFEKAAQGDLIKLLAAPGHHSLHIPKWILTALAYAVVTHEFTHLSGPTGTAKSSLIEALSLEPENMLRICSAMGLPPRPIKLYPVEMASFELPGELYQRRSLKDGNTYDEPSILVRALRDAAKAGDVYPLIWLREIGRVHTPNVQGGLLNLMTKHDVVLPGGERLRAGGIGWIADSNYQAESSNHHTLAPFDDSLKRRFSVNITMDYLTTQQEKDILRDLIGAEVDFAEYPDAGDLFTRITALGAAIRKARGEGSLLSIAPPTIYGYLTFARMALSGHAGPPPRVAKVTMLGNASVEDQKLIGGLLQEVFGDMQDSGQDPTRSANVL